MKRILLICLALCIALGVAAQEKKPAREKFSPERFDRKLEDFVIREVKLTPLEAQKFFPLLHEMHDKQRKNLDKGRAVMASVGEKSTEAQYADALNKAMECEVANKKLEKEYLRKFHDVLSWEKIYKVKRALDRFHMEVLRRFAPPRQGQNAHDNWDWRRHDWQSPRQERAK